MASDPSVRADRPLISVIVPTYRAAAVIDGAVASLAAQRFRDFEVVVSDGGSDDATLAIVEHHRTALPRLVVDSRRDTGIYDAINRGVAGSSGAWFLVLGADDRLHAPDTLARAASWLDAMPPAVELVHGDVRMMGPNLTGTPVGGRYAGPIDLARLQRANVCQQAVFYRRTLFDVLGGFDERFPLHADWAFNLRAAIRGPWRWIDLVVADYAATGASGARHDPAFQAARPWMLRDALLTDPGAPWLAGARTLLLRDANQARRQRRWRDAARLAVAWLQVALRPVRRSGGERRGT
jgi:glycosyltransferase involved in cell wall biosynthesis